MDCSVLSRIFLRLSIQGWYTPHPPPPLTWAPSTRMYVQVVSPAILAPNKGHFAWVQLEFPSRKREVMKKWANYFSPSCLPPLHFLPLVTTALHSVLNFIFLRHLHPRFTYLSAISFNFRGSEIFGIFELFIRIWIMFLSLYSMYILLWGIKTQMILIMININI